MHCPECRDRDTECVDTDSDWGGHDVEIWQCNKCNCEWEIETSLSINTQGDTNEN